ncbi:MAG: hypothetical protein R8G34_00545 [Paracoccaceae bacterium]|nr:hypothetical protein [Paracoccaceae bacterium]
MFDLVKNTALATSISLSAFMASGALAGTGIGAIDVKTTLEAPQGSNALDLYPTIADDLTREIMQRVDTTTDPTAPIISVTIKKVSLDGDTILPDSAEFNELQGVLSYQGGSRQVVEPINLSAHTDLQSMPEGYVVKTPSDADFYNAMIVTFAERVLELVPAEDVKIDG